MTLVVVPVVFLNIVKVIPPDDGGPVHLQLGDHTGEDTATDGHLASEGTLFVDVVSNASLSWGLEAKPRVAHEPEILQLEMLMRFSKRNILSGLLTWTRWA